MFPGKRARTNFPISNPEQAGPGGNCDAFISKVSILNGIQLNPSALTFSAQSLNTTSAPLTLTLTNGDNPLTISTITLGGANSDAFAITSASTCAAPSSLNPGAKCTIVVTFTPTTPGVSNASITIADSAPGGQQVVSLTGTASTLTLSASSLDFGTVAVGSTSAPQSITATNDGTSAITFSSITASGDFKETDNCTTPLQMTTNCTINVTFTPTSTNSSVGALTITDNAPGSPQIVLLTGSGFVQTSDFTIGAVTPAAAITAGGTASYSVVLTSIAGFSAPLNMSCTGLPKETSCSFSANPVTPTPDGVVVTVGISTAERTMIAADRTDSRHATIASDPQHQLGLGRLACLMLLLFGGITAGTQRGRRAAATLVFAAGLILFSVACNGGGATGAAAGTPAGTYTINIVASSANGTITHSTPVTLQVK